MATLAIFTPSQALLKNHRQLPMGYQYVPTGALTVCGKRKRQPGDPPPARAPPVSTAKQRKVPTQEELAAKEKQQKIALLAKRLELLKAHQQLLLTSPHLAPPVSSSSASLLTTPRVGGKRVKKQPGTASASAESRRSGRAVKTPKFHDNDAAPATPTPKKAANPYEQQIADLSATVANLAKHITTVSKGERVPKVPKNLDATPLTNHEKQTLKADLFKLPTDKLEPVIQLCSQNSGVEAKSEESITIDIDKLDIPTLRKLQKYVKKCIAEMNRKKKSPAVKRGAVAPSPILQSPPVPQPSPTRPPPTPVPPQIAIPAPAPQRHHSESESDSDSSSSSESDSEAEPEKESLVTPTPQPAAYLEPAPLPTFDAAAWSNLGGGNSSGSVASGDGLWSSFRSKEQEQRNHEAERRQMEERLAAERAREVEELRKRAAEERSRQDAENLRLMQLREAELDRNEQERENAREAARLARQTAQTVDLGQQGMMMDLMDSFS